MLQVTVNRRYGVDVTEYYTSTIIFPLLQTKEGMKTGYFSLVQGISHDYNMAHPPYKSVGVTCNMLQVNCDYISRSE